MRVMPLLRIGVAGFGLAGEVFHAPLIAAVDGLELSAVMTRSPERAARATEKFPGVRVVAQLLDLGSHLVDQAIVLFGPPLAVYAELHTRRPGAQVEDDVFIALEHDGGVRSHLWMSATAPLFGPRFRVSGLRGGFASDG